MFGNPRTYPFGGRSNQLLASFADKFADEILADVHRLNSGQSEQFFEWLGQHFHENNFDYSNSAQEERLRIWLSLQSAVLLLLEYQIILSKVGEYRRSNEETKD